MRRRLCISYRFKDCVLHLLGPLPSRRCAALAGDDRLWFKRANIRGDQNSALKVFTAAAGPCGWSQTPEEPARKSAPASTRGVALAVVMPPMATQGTTIISAHQCRVSISALMLASLVVVGKKAPKAT